MQLPLCFALKVPGEQGEQVAEPGPEVVPGKHLWHGPGLEE